MEGDSIVCATDMSDGSKPAATFARQAADLLDLPLIMVHVIESSPTYWPDVHGMLKETDIEARAAGRLDEWSDEVFEAGGKPDSTKVFLGSTSKGFKKAAEEHEPALMVVGMSGESTMDRLAFGSTAMELTYNPPAPVAIVHPEHATLNRATKLGVGTDLSEESDKAITFGAEWANALGGLTLHLIHSTAVPGIHSVDQSELPEALDESALHNRAREKLYEAMERNQSALKDIECEPHVISKLASRGVLDFVEKENLDILVLGANRHAGGQAAIIASVALKTVWFMKSTVIVVPQ